MSGRYGPNTAEVEALMTAFLQITIEEAEQLADAWLKVSNERWVPAWMEAMNAVRRGGRLLAYDALTREIRNAEHFPTFAVVPRLTSAIYIERSAVLALLVRDLIAEQDFKLLYGPWRSVMEVEK